MLSMSLVSTNYPYLEVDVYDINIYLKVESTLNYNEHDLVLLLYVE